MNFEINENQKMIAQMVRDFAEKEIRPNLNDWDRDETFPVEAMKKMGELGLLGIYIPEEYGGSGFGYFEYATALMELGKVCGCYWIDFETRDEWGGTREETGSPAAWLLKANQKNAKIFHSRHKDLLAMQYENEDRYLP